MSVANCWPSCNLEPGAKLLDVGTGSGLIPELVGEIAGPGVVVAACDPDPSMLAIARGRLSRSVDMRQRGLESLQKTYPNESFDVVIVANALHLAADLADAVGQMTALLRRGGLLGIVSGYFDGAINREDRGTLALFVRLALQRLRAETAAAAGPGCGGVPGDGWKSADRSCARSSLATICGSAVNRSSKWRTGGISRWPRSASEMFASGVFEGVDAPAAQRALTAAADEIAASAVAPLIHRNFLIVHATLADRWRNQT